MADAGGKDTTVRIDAALKEDLWREAGSRGVSIRRYVNDTLKGHMSVRATELQDRGALDLPARVIDSHTLDIGEAHRSDGVVELVPGSYVRVVITDLEAIDGGLLPSGGCPEGSG